MLILSQIWDNFISKTPKSLKSRIFWKYWIANVVTLDDNSDGGADGEKDEDGDEDVAAQQAMRAQ